MRSSPDGHSPGLPAVLAATANRFSRSGIGVLLFLAPAALAAQTAIVVGRVSDAASTKPVVGASVVIDGSTLGATTGADGRYRLVNVPAGARVLVARRIGFGAQRVTITVPSSGEVTANFSLSASAISLDQVVVTGTAGAQEKRSIGNAVATINASDELRKSGATTVSSLLSGRAPGVTVRARSGRLGASPAIEIRGRNSLSLENAPLLFIDGVRVNNATSSGPLAVAGRLGGQGATVAGRLNDIDPNDIESIEIIKGPAAATIYGTEAANGVIQIITKRGALGGKPQLTFQMEQGTMEFANAAERVQTNYYRIPATQQIATWNGIEAEADSGRPIYRTGQLRKYTGSLSGSREAVRYYVSGTYEHSLGIEPNNSIRQLSMHSNLDVQVRPSTNFATSLNFVTAGNHLGADVGASPLLGAQVGHANVFPATRGFFAAVPEVPQTLYDNSDRIDRFTASATLTNKPLGFFTQRAIVGIDYTGEDARSLERFAPPELARYLTPTAAAGSIGQTLRRNSIVSADYSGSAVFDLPGSVKSRTSVGGQFYRTALNTSFLGGLAFPAPGVEVVSGATTALASTQSEIINTTIGAYTEQQLSWREKLFITGGLRVDNNSAFGADFKWVTYPKISGSWVIGEESFFPLKDVFNTLRLRAAYGESGRQPAAFAALRTFAAATGPNGSSAVTPASLGNPDLRPERGKEVEVGFEAGVFNRLTLDFTYFNKRTLDQVVSQPVAPSSGFPGSQFRNLGRVDNSGVELSATYRAVTRKSFSWDINGNIATNGDKIRDLGGIQNVVASAGNANIVGYPIGGIWAKRVASADRNETTNLATNVLCDGGAGKPAVACASAPFVYIGTVTPKVIGALGSTVTIGQRLRLYALADFRSGNRVQNAVEQLRCTGGVGASLCRANYYPLEYSPIYLAGAVPTAPGQGLTAEYFQDASFVKLREVSATYTLPESWLRSRTSITIAGRNLMTRTNYRGLDPEANANNAGTTTQALDQAVTPPLRMLTATINVIW
ncbi:MAG: SusC/RagA family TonB-linked outer membrane protein [Gemmatimonadota bacterium]|nr:SusC/RagA family TonB-linked outer membrane protein [Gemmatimonadota bacterium]